MKKRLLFIHHSTGGNLIHQGNLREKLYQQTTQIELWDHGYNLYKDIPRLLLNIIANKLTFHTGLSNDKGMMLFKDFNIKLGNNDPKDFEKLFCTPSTTLDQILGFDIIAFKNCFPTTKIESDEKLRRYKNHYEQMAIAFEKLNDKIFIPFTPPPLRKEVTTTECAHRAKEFASWLATTWKRSSSVHVFDLFDTLADERGFLKSEYCPMIPIDSHPNKHANQLVADTLVSFLVKEVI